MPGEDPWPAGLRELYEETSIRSIERLGEIADWLTYDIPRDIVGQAWGGKYRGQTQKWYALRFTGDDREIDIATPGGGAHKPEFIAWRWEPMERLPDLVVPFKRPVYERVVARVRPVHEAVANASGEVIFSEKQPHAKYIADCRRPRLYPPACARDRLYRTARPTHHFSPYRNNP